MLFINSLWPQVSLVVAAATALPLAVNANDLAPKAVLVIVGDADRLIIGQDGFCGRREEIAPTSNARFRISSRVKTFFFVRSAVKDQIGTHYCEGDYSFTPEPDKLHIIRYSFEGTQCRLEMFSSMPGETPKAIPFEREESRSCLLR